MATDIQDTVYHQPAAIAIIALNVISFLSLAFVLSIYLAKWKKIASFPMRLVNLRNYFSPFISAWPVFSRTYMSSCSTRSLLTISKDRLVPRLQAFVCLREC